MGQRRRLRLSAAQRSCRPPLTTAARRPKNLKGVMLLETLVDDFILDERGSGNFDPVAAMWRKLSDNIARNRLHIREDYARASFEFNRAKEQKEVAASCAYRLYLDDSERLASMEVLDPPTLLPLIEEALGAAAALQ
ncbi:hypothetical protein ILFOPFJJ_04980 [Ensifer psoraleae]|nr:hypothetical protein [Sinorhizobium psoraleae]